MVGLVNPPVPALLALPIIGTGLAEAKAAYPQMVCDDSMCGFDPKPSPPELCPELGACKQMTLFVRDDRVVGYTAEFPSIAFMATVGHLTRELGAPKTEVRHVAMMTDASWSWVVGNGMSLSLILYGGRNMFNAPISSQTILLEPGT